MKDLLKEWKILVQNSQSNGVAPPSQLTTPTPSISSAPRSTTPTLVPSEESSSESGVTQKQNPQLSHRKLLLNKLSAFKKPQTTSTTAPSSIEPVNTSHSLPAVSLPPLPVSNGKPGNNSLTIRYPLARLPKQETQGPLLVSISLSLIKLSGCDEDPPTGKASLVQPGLNERSSPLSFQSLSPVPYQETRSSPLPPPSLSLPPPPSLSPPPSFSLPSSPTLLTHPLIVSIPLSLLTNPTLVPAAGKPLPTTMQQVHEESSSMLDMNSTNSVSGKTLRSISPEQPTSRLKVSPLILPPPDCLPGFDGTIGSDGNWYSWTDVIHHPKPTVTILPYVYIDGFDMNEL